MDAAFSTSGSFASLRQAFSPAMEHAPDEGELLASIVEAAENKLSCATDQLDPTEQASAIFRTTHGGSTPQLEPQTEERHLPPPSHKELDSDLPLPGAGKRVFSEVNQSNRPPTKRQKTNKPPWCALPQTAVACIFQRLGMQENIAFSMASKPFLRASEECWRQRCIELFASDAEHHWFERFGIDCPRGSTPGPARMKAMIARIEVILHSMKYLLQEFQFQGVFLPGYTAEELVLQAPAADLQAPLEVAYQCNLCKIFGRLANLPGAITLNGANERIQAWLGSEEAKRVEDLDTAGFGLTCLPSEVGRLVNLRCLSLKGNQLASIPTEIGELPVLEQLNLDGNRLSAIPAAIGKLMRLVTLYLSQNKFIAVPSGVWQLVNIRELFLDGNQLITIPPEVGNLLRLASLDLGNNHLELLPAALGRLLKLQYLNLNNNQLMVLPPEVGNLLQLESLDLGNNHLESLPAALGRLLKLQYLNLNNNQLMLLSPEVGNLLKLESLDLGNNHLQSLPAALGHLLNLQQLSLNNNQLESLPEEIGNLLKLESLDLSNNHLQSLPAALGHLLNLQQLSLNNNQLESLPEEIGQLANLYSLTLNNNKFVKIPATVRATRGWCRALSPSEQGKGY